MMLALLRQLGISASLGESIKRKPRGAIGAGA